MLTVNEAKEIWRTLIQKELLGDHTPSVLFFTKLVFKMKLYTLISLRYVVRHLQTTKKIEKVWTQKIKRYIFSTRPSQCIY